MGASPSRYFNPDIDIGDLTGKVILVTGGNSGIGYATIQHLARRGAKVYMGARYEKTARDAIQRLEKDGLGPGNGEIQWLKVGLSDPRDAKAAAQEFMKREARLDVIINNAAVILTPYTITHDNIQDTMMVNYLSPVVFTRTLLPVLEKTAKEPGSDVRIVNVSSDAMILCKGLRFRNRDDFNDSHASSWWPSASRYVRTKLANALFAAQLQRRFDAMGIPIITLAVHPGCVNTEGYQAYAKQKGGIIGLVWSWIGRVFLLSPTEGALNSVFAAVAPVVRANADAYKGAHLRLPGVIGAPNKEALDVELARELWQTTDNILKEIGIDV